MLKEEAIAEADLVSKTTKKKNTTFSSAALSLASQNQSNQRTKNYSAKFQSLTKSKEQNFKTESIKADEKLTVQAKKMQKSDTVDVADKDEENENDDVNKREDEDDNEDENDDEDEDVDEKEDEDDYRNENEDDVGIKKKGQVLFKYRVLLIETGTLGAFSQPGP